MNPGRNQDLTALAGKLRRMGYEEQAILEQLLVSPERRDLPETECRTIARSIGQKPGGIPREEIQQLQKLPPFQQFAQLRGWTEASLNLIGAQGHDKIFFGDKTYRRVVTFPLYDADKNIVGRRIRKSDNSAFGTKDGAPKALSVKGGKMGLIQPSYFPSTGTVHIVEGEADACAALTAGLSTVIGTPGTNPGVIAREALQRICAKREVVLWPQSGTPGQRWRDEIGDLLLAVQCAVYYVPNDPKVDDLDDRLKREPNQRDAINRWLSGKMEYQTISKEEKKERASVVYNDTYNGEQFAQDHRGNSVYVPETKSWFVWSGSHWQRDMGSIKTTSMAKATVERLRIEAESLPEDERKAARNHAKASGNANKLDAMMATARSEDGMARSATLFDQNHFLLAVKNGTIDLKTGEIRPHDPEDWMTRRSSIQFASDAKAPRWETFLQEIFSGDEELISYIKRLVGYCLTGSVKEQGLWVFWGSGANGKSVFTSVLDNLLGEYHLRCDPELFVEGRARAAGQASPHIIALKGRRIAIASETKAGAKMAETALKELTGGDKLTGRQLHQEPQEFHPTHKLILLTNHRPRVTQDPALWRRLRLVPFEVSFEGREDKNLADTLKKEVSGILRWAVEGCLEWQRDGLKTPEKVKAATEEYKREEDVVGRFLEECCRLEPARTTSTALFSRFQIWLKGQGIKAAWTQRQLSLELKNRNIESIKSDGIMVWNGLSIIHNIDGENSYYEAEQRSFIPAKVDTDWQGGSF